MQQDERIDGLSIWEFYAKKSQPDTSQTTLQTE